MEKWTHIHSPKGNGCFVATRRHGAITPSDTPPAAGTDGYVQCVRSGYHRQPLRRLTVHCHTVGIDEGLPVVRGSFEATVTQTRTSA